MKSPNVLRHLCIALSTFTIIGSALLIPSPASAADFCCLIKTNPGVTPIREEYHKFSGAYACYTAMNCEGQEASCNASCDCDQPLEKCAINEPAKNKQPYLVTYRLKGDLPDSPARTECTEDSRWCQNNDPNSHSSCGAVATDCSKCPNFDFCKNVVPGATGAKPIPPLTNPLGTSDIRVIVARAIKIFTGISGSLALLMFVYGGFLWVTSAGNMDKVKHGQKAIVNASLGLIIIFTAYGVIAAIFKALSGIAI